MTSVTVRGIRIDPRTGKISKQAPRMSVSKKIGQSKKADRDAAKWLAKGKKR